ncbi:TetR/AcrR family transcriptional regulator [Euzebya rosea]|uniref:TetR/AcrR family transcriptional regulator n=1 Tax=Euzebya rosea TaxID=2052804 RepID=UPI001472EF93|nr:TetR/AcrR family transcriptional regulator [Euzebya rosea]
MASPELTVVTALDDSEAEPGQDDEVADALLVAARAQMETFGIRRLRMDDVAKQAGYGRATLYRRFATRDELVWAVIIREVRATLAEIEAAITDLATFRDRLVEAFAATVEKVRTHPLLQRLIQIEPDLLLPHLTTGAPDALSVARKPMRRLLQQGRDSGDLGPIDLDIAAEVMIRLAHSLVLTPGGPIEATDPAGLRRFAATHVVDPLLHLSALAGGPAARP